MPRAIDLSDEHVAELLADVLAAAPFAGGQSASGLGVLVDGWLSRLATELAMSDAWTVFATTTGALALVALAAGQAGLAGAALLRALRRAPEPEPARPAAHPDLGRLEAALRRESPRRVIELALQLCAEHLAPAGPATHTPRTLARLLLASTSPDAHQDLLALVELHELACYADAPLAPAHALLAASTCRRLLGAPA